MTAIAFIFPGQGSQFVGMGRDLAAAFSAARNVFEEVDDALGERLSRIIFEGPAEELTLTSNTQPALMAVSMAAIRAFLHEAGKQLGEMAAVVAGHSLGEYSALVAAESFSVPEGAKLLRIRGDAMQRAVPLGEGAMAALLGSTIEQARTVCEEAAQGEVVGIANDNGGGQVVISGAIGAVDRAIELSRMQGVKRAMKLPVSAPFHSPLMAPAADAMRGALVEAPPRSPVVPLIANVTASSVTDAVTISANLVEQVTATVRWRESVSTMADLGITRFIEFGAGKVLAGLVKRIAPEAEALSCGSPAELEQVLKHVL